MPNFGDAIAPLLLARFSDLEVEWAPPGEAQVVSVGSVLEHMPASFTGYVVGTGLLRDYARTKFNPANAKILALRGPLTAKGIWGNIALGDPGLLANELIEPVEKEWDLGIIPHWKDKILAEKFAELIKYPSSTHVIDPGGDPLDVIRQIAGCRKVVTSSLHGMIVADAFAIPRRVEVPDVLFKEGGWLKYKDYALSIRMKFVPGKMQSPLRRDVEDAQSSIWQAFRELSHAHIQ